MLKQEKKSWKEKQRERQMKQQRSQETHQKKSEHKPRRKHRLSKGTIAFAIGLAAILVSLSAYGLWQYNESQKPPVICGNASPTSSTDSTLIAQDFTLKDINGKSVSLKQFKGRVIGIHFMAVGCHGQINPISQFMLYQLSGVCSSYCGNEPVTILTVAVATCANSGLEQLRADYNATWILGNDYDDGALDIVNAYIPYEIGDGSVVLVDKEFNIAQVYNGGVTSQVLSAAINQLLQA